MVSCACIFQLKGYHSVVKIAYGYSESSFLCIFWCHSTLVVFAESIHKGEHGVSCCRIYQVVYVWQREFVLRVDLVEISEVYVAPYLPILLLHYRILDNHCGCWMGLMKLVANSFCTSFTICSSILVKHSGRLSHRLCLEIYVESVHYQSWV